MTFSEILMVLAVLLAPVVAIQVSVYLERRRERVARRRDLFRTLMATRASRLAPMHVEALNMIDLEFYGNDQKLRSVRNAWKAYLDHLNDRGVPPEVWGTRGDDLFVEMMYAMAVSLGYEFDRTYLRRAAYYPTGHGQIELDQIAIRRGLADVLQGKAGIPVVVHAPQSGETPSALAADSNDSEMTAGAAE